MHPGQLLGDGVLRAVLLLRQALNPPDLGKKLADLLLDVLAVLLSHSIIKLLLHPNLFRLRSIIEGTEGMRLDGTEGDCGYGGTI